MLLFKTVLHEAVAAYVPRTIVHYNRMGYSNFHNKITKWHPKQKNIRNKIDHTKLIQKPKRLKTCKHHIF